ncbi:hypothetical protein ACFP3T_09705 [Lactiplantibacillus dongliensis]|uniref:Uncharacterized protein n=1 Tax=Lactiplantibacillus dongliensis TaxID=2559919 RepID=A0ABW1R4Z0_9LACO
MKRRQLLWMTLLGVLGLILGTSMTMTASAKYANTNRITGNLVSIPGSP